ncbi:MAG: 2-amino-4-hydroxy-6-hydroxymethyldihydropteridine diphosphokinase [Actinotignum sanguinis]|uniref:2-amino-4-hydroxy-6- hydroxymethyldihydropteridine diphosphokinase n=1 Tax=Actinomycetaceae TaxID=2049 RepID=UPI00237E4564|nr:2-amino-4-hydroxy-6-hydroxymethyldihydropteridine diphosphokinase [Actinotignum sanguinis]MDE1552756.1 2-amino-4-hydroxy-6-hydroxymethyldihydropteridine diphosphokinase [Actinotignum sanguinis]MDE1564689.1 2-amino-4-hydroxy-6-hydroxymethyldihydropteridine diphosphokinase [Actinotignum sanguinis]MDE1576724.1 2-amino-4-hydroxy-6-hydroxymethyldihydropteridine diphosphokinase [Actinotignum sanguinis]MDE1642626.1 2-amino-4-hydroxy-6-hydroxymethyldihydropteridine diphosphokinase [Actinotignum sang
MMGVPPRVRDALAMLGCCLDTVSITGVEVAARHGVYQYEREADHPFIFDVAALVDTSAAGRTDDLAGTISYADLAEDARAVGDSAPVSLLETLGERVAQRVLARGALAVEVTVHKPEAPVPGRFTDARVTVRRLADIARGGTIREMVIGMGANLGEREETLRAAITQIAALPVHINAVSSFRTTAPVLAPGQAPQPDYLNAVMRLTTELAPLNVLAALRDIEVRAGRERRMHWGARTLDLDIEWVEGMRSTHPLLTLPHPRAHTRDFVMEPWQEIDPDATAKLARVRESEHTSAGGGVGLDAGGHRA